MNTSQPTSELDAALIKQISFKPGVCRSVACKIVRAFLSAETVGVWPDTIDFSDVAGDDKNAIGLAFRRLRTIGLIEQTGQYKGSDAKGSKGRAIFQWRLNSTRIAKTFLERNGDPWKETQAELSL